MPINHEEAGPHNGPPPIAPQGGLLGTAGAAVPAYTHASLVNEEAVIRKGKPRKALTDNVNATVEDIFGVGEPYIINTPLVDKFLAVHPELVSQQPYQVAAPKTLIGIEVEVENVLLVDPNIPLVFWQVKNDGSLRNHGVEFVTPGVISAGLMAEPALKLLFNGLNRDIDFSPRTSIHVHVDVRSLTLNQLLSLLLVYTVTENILFKFVGNSRRNNIFCVPITETGLFDGLMGGPRAFLHAVDSHWAKYSALNLLPCARFGSIEFRHMPGTSTIRHIMTWIDLITRLKLYAHKYPYEAVLDQVAQLNSNSRYKQFVEGVFGDCIAFLDTSNLLTDMEKAVHLIKNAVISNKFHTQVVNTKNVWKSQLGKFIGSFLEKLRPEQREALMRLSVKHGETDVEHLFRNIIQNPIIYRRAWPDDLVDIDAIIINAEHAKTVKKAFKVEELNMIYDQLLPPDHGEENL